MADSVRELIAAKMLEHVNAITAVLSAYRGTYKNLTYTATETVHVALTLHGDGYENPTAYPTRDVRTVAIFRLWSQREDDINECLEDIRGLWMAQSGNTKWTDLRTLGVQRIMLMPDEAGNPITAGAEMMAVQPIMFTYRETYS